MGSFSQFLESIHLQPAAFAGIIAGALLFLVFVITLVYVHRRTKRKIMEGAFDKPDISILSLTHPRPPSLTARRSSSRSSLVDREVQQQDIVGREVRQQEATYAQLIVDLQKPVSLSLPNQTPREYSPRMDATQAAVEDKSLGAPLLQRGHSIRSLDSASMYSVASALPDAPERAHQSFNVLATIPASPHTFQWPTSPGPYIWPKRQRSSLIRDELAPETYARARWRTDGKSVDPTATTIPVARSVAPAGLRINVDHRTALPTALSPPPQRPY